LIGTEREEMQNVVRMPAVGAVGAMLLVAACEIITVPEPTTIASIEVTPSADTVEVAGTVQLMAVVRDSRGDVVEGAQVTWSSDREFLTVDPNGIASAVAPPPSSSGSSGAEVRVSAAIGEVTGEALLFVLSPVGSLSLGADALIRVGRSKRLSTLVQTPAGDTIPRTVSRWTSSDPTVIGIDSAGVATALALGEAVVTASVAGVEASVSLRAVAGYALVALGTLAGDSSAALGLNDRRQVVGRAQDSRGEWRAFVWETGRMQDLGTLRDFSTATAINNAGLIVGSTTTPLHPFETQAVRWSDGEVLPLPDETLAWRGHAVDVDETGRILVASVNLGILWVDGDTIQLRNEESQNFHPRAFNEHGDVVGSDTWSGLYRALILRDGVFGTVASSRVPPASATGINNRGDVIGVTGNEYVHEAFLREAGGGNRPLPSLGGRQSIPADLNDSRQVVGLSDSPAGEQRGVLWSGGRISDLTDLVDDADWIVVAATAINEAGDIVGLAKRGSSGPTRAVLLIPEPQ
jgi:probable HAF family extracellular repeat protein